MPSSTLISHCLMFSCHLNQLLQANCPCEIQWTLYTAIPRSALICVCTQHSGSNMDPSLHSGGLRRFEKKRGRGGVGGKEGKRQLSFPFFPPCPPPLPRFFTLSRIYVEHQLDPGQNNMWCAHFDFYQYCLLFIHCKEHFLNVKPLKWSKLILQWCNQWRNSTLYWWSQVRFASSARNEWNYLKINNFS